MYSVNFIISAGCSFSVVIAAILAAWKFHAIHPVFRPFIYCIWLGLLNELVSFVLARVFHTAVVNSNIYVLMESLLLLWQFRKWGLFSQYPVIYYFLLTLLPAVWTAENFIFFSIFQFSSWFRIFYSFVIVLLSVSLLNRQIVGDKGVLLKNPVALICLAFIIYYTFKILVETFWVYGLNENTTFQIKIYFILDCINLFSNLVYALAVLWMPIKHQFTTPYSSAVPS